MTVWQAMHALEGLGYRFRATGGGVKAEVCGEAPPESSALLDIVRSDREAARAAAGPAARIPLTAGGTGTR